MRMAVRVRSSNEASDKQGSATNLVRRPVNGMVYTCSGGRIPQPPWILEDDPASLVAYDCWLVEQSGIEAEELGDELVSARLAQLGPPPLDLDIRSLLNDFLFGTPNPEFEARGGLREMHDAEAGGTTWTEHIMHMDDTDMETITAQQPAHGAQQQRKYRRQEQVDTSSNPYDPGAMLNALMRIIGAANDSELARRLQLDENILTRVRTRRLQLSRSMLYFMQHATGISIDELRHLLNDRRSSLR